MVLGKNTFQLPQLNEAMVNENQATSRNLFFLGFVTLFLELVAIRWIGTEIRVFAYVQNIILIVCFLGLGMGSLRPARSTHWVKIVLPLIFLHLVVSLPFLEPLREAITKALSLIVDFSIWEKGKANSIAVTVCLASLALAISSFLLQLL